MAKQSTSEYAQYAKLRKQFGLLGEEFERRCDPSGPRVYHQRLVAVDSPNDDPPLLNRFVVKCDTLASAWSAFIDIYRGRLLQEGWEEWDVFPDTSACSRFYGTGSKVDLRDFLGLARRGYQILVSLRALANQGVLVPPGLRLELPSYSVDQASYGWLDFLYGAGRSCRTTVLNVENKGLWGELGSPPNNPHYDALDEDLFRSSSELVRLVLTPDDVVRVGDWASDPPIYLPPPESSARQKRNEPKGIVLRIDQWTNLGVGIHTDGYYAFSPCPSPGENIVLGNAVQLPLVGKRWRKVLTCLARSPDGRTASKEELVRELGYVKTGDLNRDQAEHDDGLIEKAKKAQDTLRATMADLASELRSLVATNGTSTVFQSEGDNYQAAFVARHLMPDQTRHLRFGSVE